MKPPGRRMSSPFGTASFSSRADFTFSRRRRLINYVALRMDLRRRRGSSCDVLDPIISRNKDLKILERPSRYQQHGGGATHRAAVSSFHYSAGNSAGKNLRPYGVVEAEHSSAHLAAAATKVNWAGGSWQPVAMTTVPVASEAGIIGSAAGLITAGIVLPTRYDDWWPLIRPLFMEMRLIRRKTSHVKDTRLLQRTVRCRGSEIRIFH